MAPMSTEKNVFSVLHNKEIFLPVLPPRFQVTICRPALITPASRVRGVVLLSNGYTNKQVEALSGSSLPPGDAGNLVLPAHTAEFQSVIQMAL